MSARSSISAPGTCRPRREYWFGTDNVGRDIFTRVIFGYRISLLLALVVLGTAVPVGTALGLLAGYFGGWVEIVIMRLTDIALAIPPLVMALAVAAVLSPDLINSMLAIAALWWTWHTRLIYSITRQLRTQEFVEAAETLGASKFHILFREILPNCVSAMAVKTSLDCGFVILVGASLSFLGLGIQPPTPDLGTMVASGSAFLPDYWWESVLPGAPSCSSRSASTCSATACATSSTCRRSDERSPAFGTQSQRRFFDLWAQPTTCCKGVSLDVPARSQVALVGESGSRQDGDDEGHHGPPAPAAGHDHRRRDPLSTARDLLTMPARERLKLRGTAMSMVFQDPMSSLNPVFTIADQMGTILKYADRRLGRARGRRERMARVHEVLAQVRMRDPERVAASYPIMLSGGMRQRVLIAMALLSEPQLLIADEPGTALDVTTQAQILKLLKDLVEERGLALLMITHNLGVVRETSSYVYVMNKGVVVEERPTAELFANPVDAYTKSLIAAVPRLTGGTELSAAREAAHERRCSRSGGSRRAFPCATACGRGRGEVKAVDDVSFTIDKGEVYGLAGESGSGKSTIARMIMGLTKPTSGRDPARWQGHHRLDRHPRLWAQGANGVPESRLLAQSTAHRGPVDRRAARCAWLSARRSRPPHRRAARNGATARRVRLAVSARTVGRPEAARGDCPGAGGDAAAHRARRADLGARCLGAGPGHRPSGRSRPAARADLPVHLARPQPDAEFRAAMWASSIWARLSKPGRRPRCLRSPQHDYTRLLLASVPVISAEEEAMRPVIPLIDGEIPTAEQLLALRQAGTSAPVSQRTDK